MYADFAVFVINTILNAVRDMPRSSDGTPLISGLDKVVKINLKQTRSGC